MGKAHAFAHIDGFFRRADLRPPNYGYTSGHYRALVSDKICERLPAAMTATSRRCRAAAARTIRGARRSDRATLWTYMLTD